MRKLALAVISFAALSACNLAPPYIQPAPPVPPVFPVSSRQTGEMAKAVSWERFFGDPQLKAYITAALSRNRDLATATARIAQAKAQFRVQQAQRLPGLDSKADAGRTRTPLGSLGLGDALGDGSVTFNQYSVQIAATSFELDFWGRVRNLSEAARRQYLATVEAQRAFRLSLIGDVAATYYAIRAGEEGIALAERTVASRRQGLDIAKLRLDAGVTSSVDYDQAALLVTQADTDLAELRRTTEQQRNQLLVLIGGPLGGPLPEARSINDAGQFETLDPGLPSALLADRPDVLEAEHQLHAANANIGAARAAFFPTISLTGAFGFVSPQLDGLVKSKNQNWSVSGGAALPIFDWGKRKASLDVAKAQHEELVATYQRTVQNAFREVSDALVGRQRYREQIVAQEQAVAAQRRLAETAMLRYDNGIAIYLEVLDAQRNLFSAEQQLIKLRATELQNGVSLYTALGGGLANTRFEQGDAAMAMPEEAPFDRLFSRFGSMFFSEPYPAFANLRRMLREGGRLDIAVWAPIDENPWQRSIMGIIKEHIDLPTPQPRAPGPFALGDQDYVIDLLQGAGFSDIKFDAWTSDQRIGGPGSDPGSAARFVLDGMHVGDLVRPSGAEVRSTIQRDLVELFERNRDEDGVRMGAKAWLVSAHA